MRRHAVAYADALEARREFFDSTADAHLQGAIVAICQPMDVQIDTLRAFVA